MSEKRKEIREKRYEIRDKLMMRGRYLVFCKILYVQVKLVALEYAYRAEDFAWLYYLLLFKLISNAITQHNNKGKYHEETVK